MDCQELRALQVFHWAYSALTFLCRLKEVYDKLGVFVRHHIFYKGDISRLQSRRDFRPVFRAAALRALSAMPVQEHQEVVPELSKGQMRPLTFSQLQAYGLLSLQPVSGEGTMYRVTMSAASLDGYLTSVDGDRRSSLHALYCMLPAQQQSSSRDLICDGTLIS